MLIGIDGGGTKTALCVATIDGRVLGEYTGMGTNPADIGLEECEKRLSAQLDALIASAAHAAYAQYGISADALRRGAGVAGVYAGIAGSANQFTSRALNGILRRVLPECARVDNGSDAFNALYGEVGDGEGIALIAGTGSSAFTLTRDGTVQVGGWGYLIDDAGSGFRIGADALKAAYRAMDGRGAATTLTDMCISRLSAPLGEAIPEIYAGGKKFIASFAPIAFQAARAGDGVALNIIDGAAEALAAHVRACARHIKRFPAICVISGGLTNDADFIESIRQKLERAAPDKFILCVPELAPVYGALLRAALNAGCADPAAFRANYINRV